MPTEDSKAVKEVKKQQLSLPIDLESRVQTLESGLRVLTNEVEDTHSRLRKLNGRLDAFRRHAPVETKGEDDIASMAGGNGPAVLTADEIGMQIREGTFRGPR